MAGKDIITMSQEELKRLHIVHKILDRRLKQVEAKDFLDLCERQIGRIVKRVREEGDDGVIHKSRGKPSHNKLPDKIKEKVVKLYRGKYKGFGPLLFSEKLLEIEKIRISDETARQWLIEAKEWTKKRKQRQHRQWRERKKFIGEMIQIDGSHHDWLEGRGEECVLMGYIDDASNRVYARFYGYEGTKPCMDSFRRYINKYGIPLSVYIDKHSTYKSTKKQTIEEELNDREPLTQVGRALKEIGVEVIYAHSAPAKGRIERLFKTFQDRVIKEMRLRNIRTIAEANKFLKEYLPIYNKRFSIRPVEKTNLHRPIPKNIDLDRIFSVKTEHTLRNDFTIRHDKKLYQVLSHVNAKKVIVEERINGKMLLSYKDRYLSYKEIREKPIIKKERILWNKKHYVLPKDHPYRKFKISSYPQSYTYEQKEKVGQKEKELLLVEA